MGWIQIRKTWSSGDQLTLHFETDVKCHPWANDEGFISYGPLLFALPLARRSPRRAGLSPRLSGSVLRPCRPRPGPGLAQKPDLQPGAQRFDPSHPWDSLTLRGDLLDSSGGEARPVRLIPLGGSILRRVTFPRSSTGEPQ